MMGVGAGAVGECVKHDEFVLATLGAGDLVT